MRQQIKSKLHDFPLWEEDEEAPTEDQACTSGISSGVSIS